LHVSGNPDFGRLPRQFSGQPGHGIAGQPPPQLVEKFSPPGLGHRESGRPSYWIEKVQIIWHNTQVDEPLREDSQDGGIIVHAP
jgi:hypothetical protein